MGADTVIDPVGTAVDDADTPVIGAERVGAARLKQPVVTTAVSAARENNDTGRYFIGLLLGLFWLRLLWLVCAGSGGD